MDAETRRFIHEEIKKNLNILLFGAAGENNEQVEVIDQMFPGMPGIADRPVISSYGIASRAPKGTISVNARVGDHYGSRVVLGHRDKDKPIDLEEGDVAVYNMGKMQVRLANNRIRIAQSDDNTEAGMAGKTNMVISADPDADTFSVSHSEGGLFQFQPNGSVFLGSSDSSYIYMNSETNEVSLVSKDGNGVVMGSQGMLLTDKKGLQMVHVDSSQNRVQIMAAQDVIISAGRCTIQAGTINLGTTASFSAVLGELLEAYLDSHTHTCSAPGSPSTPPIIPSSVYNLNPLLSFKSLYITMRSNLL